MNAKRIVGFLLMRPAFTQRNLTSIGLVAVFFFVYVLMGGKVTTELPKAPKEGVFGSGGVDAFIQSGKKKEESKNSGSSLDAEGLLGSRPTTEAAEDILGIRQSEEREARRRASLGTTFFTEEERKAQDKPLDKEGLVTGVEVKRNRIDWNKRREARESKGRDMLSDIEERLNVGGKK